MFKVFVLLALIAVVYSVPAPAVQNEKTGESAIEVPDGAVAGDKKETLEGAESAYVAVGGLPLVRALPYSIYPYYTAPIAYTHPHRLVVTI